MSTIFDTHLFAACVRTRRGERSLREAAAEIGTVSPATLLRIEQEEVQPDLTTFLGLCDWLQLSHQTFVRDDASFVQLAVRSNRHFWPAASGFDDCVIVSLAYF